MKHYLIGLTTAVKNTAIAMTVIDAYDYVPEDGKLEEGYTNVTAFYFVGGLMQTIQLDADQFVGFGDYLIYEDGQFTEAGSHDEEEEDEEDDETDGPDSDEAEA